MAADVQLLELELHGSSTPPVGIDIQPAEGGFTCTLAAYANNGYSGEFDEWLRRHDVTPDAAGNFYVAADDFLEAGRKVQAMFAGFEHFTLQDVTFIKRRSGKRIEVRFIFGPDPLSFDMGMWAIRRETLPQALPIPFTEGAVGALAATGLCEEVKASVRSSHLTVKLKAGSTQEHAQTLVLIVESLPMPKIPAKSQVP